MKHSRTTAPSRTPRNRKRSRRSGQGWRRWWPAFPTSLIVAACTAPPEPTATQPATQLSSSSADAGPEIARRLEAAHGLEAWRDRQAVAADIDIAFGGSPVLSGSMLYDHHTGRVRLDVRDTAILFFDGERAWVSPATAKVPQARFHLVTWPSFLAAPFTLRGPGRRLVPTGPRPLGGVQHETALLTFDADVGYGPDDWYVIYEDPQTSLLAAMAYVVTYGGVTAREAEGQPRAIVYHDVVTIDGVTLPLRWTFHHWSAEAGPRGDPIGEGTLANLRFVNPGARAFAVPAGVKEDRLPPRAVARNLEAFLAGRFPADALQITYDDLHGLWGGLRLTVHGTGRVEQEAVRLAQEPPRPRDLTAGEVREIVELLLGLAAWEQRVPERPPQPDEARARLSIRAGAAQSMIWEWFNDLDGAGRIVQVREKIKDLAWSPPAGR
ncbi:MAG: hypothetical protein ACYS1B_06285 [Planctomycetota bacterium]